MTANAVGIIVLLAMLAFGVVTWVVRPERRGSRAVRGAILVPLIVLGPMLTYGLLVAWVLTEATRP